MRKNYEVLMTNLKEVLAQRGLSELTMTIEPRQKINQAEYDALSVKKEDSTIGISINLSAVIEKEKDDAAILNRLAKIIENEIKEMPGFDVDQLTNYEYMKNRLVIELANSEKNASLLMTAPHMKYEDLTIFYRFIVSSDSEGIGSILITNEMLERFGISKEQLHQDALASSPIIKPATIKTMRDTMIEIVGEEMSMFFPDDEPYNQLFVITSEDKMRGAGVICYPEVLDEAAKRMSTTSLYILPCSVHEVIVVPDLQQHNTNELIDMVRTINATEVRDEDLLSDNIYHYNVNDKEVRVVKKSDVAA